VIADIQICGCHFRVRVGQFQGRPPDREALINLALRIGTQPMQICDGASLSIGATGDNM